MRRLRVISPTAGRLEKPDTSVSASRVRKSGASTPLPNVSKMERKAENPTLPEAAAVASLSEADATSGLKEEKYLPRCAEDLKG